jgi:hypothetical protein
VHNPSLKAVKAASLAAWQTWQTGQTISKKWPKSFPSKFKGEIALLQFNPLTLTNFVKPGHGAIDTDFEILLNYVQLCPKPLSRRPLRRLESFVPSILAEAPHSMPPADYW